MKTSLIGVRSRSVLAWLACGVSCLCAAGEVSAQGYRYAVPIQTDDGWRTASLAQRAVDEAPLVSLMTRLRARENHMIHGLLLVKDGHLVFEEYFEGEDVDLFDEDFIRTRTPSLVRKRFTRDDLHYCASVTKSVISQLFGIAVDRGDVPGVDAKMLSFFPDYARFSTPEKACISVHHMLSMTTGLPFDEQSYPITDSRNDAFALYFTDDPMAFMLGRKLDHAPGTFFQYNSGTTVLLGEIIRRATGQSVTSFAEERLFAPLQIASSAWAEMPNAPGVTQAAGGLYLRPRDMAKIGQLMLQEGVWNGRRVLSADWVRRSVAEAIPVSSLGEVRGYGYQWRLGLFGGVVAYWASGWGGQYVVVLPEENAVFVQTGGRYGRERVPIGYGEIIEQYLLPAIERGRSVSESVDLSGAWTGYVIMGNGTRADIVLSLAREESGYVGSVRGISNGIPDMALRNISFERNRLTFDFDFPSGQRIELIEVRLRYRDDVLDGSYTDPTGDSDRMHFERAR